MSELGGRIAGRFADLAVQGKRALIPYIVAGDPDPGATVMLMHKLVQAGADIIELGVPFSDPMAEGPVIQKAHERALEHNVSLRDTLAMVAEFRSRDTDTPVLLMGYANPVLAMGMWPASSETCRPTICGHARELPKPWARPAPQPRRQSRP